MGELFTALLLCSLTVCGQNASDWEIPADKENFHVFLLMGQSNMSGGGHVEPEDRKPVPRLLFIPPRELKWSPASHPLHRPARGFGLGLPFAKAYLKSHPGVTVWLIPLARGGAEINRLHKGTDVYAEALKKAAISEPIPCASNTSIPVTFRRFELRDEFSGYVDGSHC
jgi:hypothetical protein